MSKRIDDLPVLGPAPPATPVTFQFNGQPVTGRAGDTVAAALWAAGIRTLGTDPRSGRGRGLFCGIGNCYECRVTVDGIPGRRACLEAVRPGLMVNAEGGDSA